MGAAWTTAAEVPAFYRLGHRSERVDAMIGQAKRRECVERLSKVLAKEFSLEELRLIQYDRGDAIRIEAFEIARTETRR
jgi:hypothetical protein